ncbi:MAG: putative metalloprotease CJM1_0395 family protein [Planctomycetota bacterium]
MAVRADTPGMDSIGSVLHSALTLIGRVRGEPTGAPARAARPVPPPSAPLDRAEISAEARRSAALTAAGTGLFPVAPTAPGGASRAIGSETASQTTAPGTTEDGTAAEGGGATARPEVGPADPSGLSAAEQQEVAELEARDREVRTHEQAHQAAGGRYAGAASYTYQQGPDGQRYAVGGSVPIDVSPVSGDPRATLAKMAQVRRAALAPAQPSAQDRAVAARAAQVAQQARAELAAAPEPDSAAESDSSPGGTAAAGAAPIDASSAAPRVENAPAVPDQVPRPGSSRSPEASFGTEVRAHDRLARNAAARAYGDPRTADRSAFTNGVAATSEASGLDRLA